MSVAFTEGREAKPPFQGIRLRALAQAAQDNTPTATNLWDLYGPKLQRWGAFVEHAASAGLLFYFASQRNLPGWARALSGITGTFSAFKAIVAVGGGD